ncbi:hypothetical protein KP509_09G047000 [Ceratopteris richardii]|uniref:Uncharacterized protein n=1 Tax=Ceratopteris richardii TaxID=49495 RepID=A0A8T2U130_CERRI|nr:hypothetical protein KP509_09G047000 [Ceratopteris richardii]
MSPKCYILRYDCFDVYETMVNSSSKATVAAVEAPCAGASEETHIKYTSAAQQKGARQSLV